MCYKMGIKGFIEFVRLVMGVDKSDTYRYRSIILRDKNGKMFIRSLKKMINMGRASVPLKHDTNKYYDTAFEPNVTIVDAPYISVTYAASYAKNTPADTEAKTDSYSLAIDPVTKDVQIVGKGTGKAVCVTDYLKLNPIANAVAISMRNACEVHAATTNGPVELVWDGFVSAVSRPSEKIQRPVYGTPPIRGVDQYAIAIYLQSAGIVSHFTDGDGEVHCARLYHAYMAAGKVPVVISADSDLICLMRVRYVLEQFISASRTVSMYDPEIVDLIANRFQWKTNIQDKMAIVACLLGTDYGKLFDGVGPAGVCDLCMALGDDLQFTTIVSRDSVAKRKLEAVSTSTSTDTRLCQVLDCAAIRKYYDYAAPAVLYTHKEVCAIATTTTLAPEIQLDDLDE